VGSGITLTSVNAADVLLSDVYSIFEDLDDQDAFFASATGKIFSSVVSGQANNSTLLEALTQGASEGRLHLWSADPDEQEKIASTDLAGTIPISDDSATAFGVYFNDSTGAKMDYYLDAAIAVGSAVCREDLRPNFDVKVRLKSTAPLDSSTLLPAYVTGKGIRDITPGVIQTNVYVYAPLGSVPYSVTIDGEEYIFVASEIDDHSVAGITVQLSPGQSTLVSMKFIGVAGAPDTVVLQHTPMASTVQTSVNNFMDCGDLVDSENQSGA
jgi:hypothetical protein